MRTPNFLTAIFSLLIFSCVFGPAHAGLITTLDSRGTLQQPGVVPPGTTITYLNTTTTATMVRDQFGDHPGVTVQANYRLDYPPGSSPSYAFSGEGYTQYFQNNPGGNQTLPPGQWLLNQWDSSLLFSPQMNDFCTAAGLLCFGAGIVVPPVGAACGTSLTLFCGGLWLYQLFENSPALVTAESSPYTGPSGNMAIGLLVNDAGDGDWLTLGVNGQEFLRVPLNSFTLDQVFVLSIPTSVLSATTNNIWMFGLESTGAPGASFSIFSVEQINQVPLPASLPLFAFGVLGLWRLKQSKTRLARR